MNSLKKLMWSHLLNRCGEACPYCLIAVLETEKTKFLTIIKQQHKALEEISDSDPDECAGRLRDIANEGLRGME